MVQLQASPYKSQSDDYLATASSFSLLMVFFCCIIYKFASLTASEDLQSKMSLEQVRTSLRHVHVHVHVPQAR